jgi:hypothetical protein
MRKIVLFSGLFMATAIVAYPQTFSSGSTGADGALELAGRFGPVNVPVPESGIFNFTTVNVPPGVVLSFQPNLRNTPVTILAIGDVFVGGQVVVAAALRTPGPGGFFGGDAGQPGFGPGGGAAGGVQAGDGAWVGPLSLVPLVGGSGGGGSIFSSGGGGGGAIVIASSTSVMIAALGIIAATGVRGPGSGSGSGAGGAIRLVANSVRMAGTLSACGGPCGVIRLEAPAGGLSFTGSSTPAAVLSTINPVVLPTPATASLAIVSIGGFPVATDAGVRPGTVDLLLPRQIPDPISVIVQAHNIPIGTLVKLNISGSPAATSAAAPLTGTLASSTATLSVAGLDRTAETHFFVFATFDVPPVLAGLNPVGPNQIAQIRIHATPGAVSRFAFLRRDGSEVDIAKVPRAVRNYFGQ